MKKQAWLCITFFIAMSVLTACGAGGKTQGNNGASNHEWNEDDSMIQTTEAAKPTTITEPTATPEPTATQAPTATPEPTATQAPTATPEPTVTPDPTAEISGRIPAKYFTPRYKDSGTLQLVSYETKDYFGDESAITKEAYVYLPAGYDEAKQYNVLYLMHGIGGDIKEWGMYNSSSVVKAVMDNLSFYGDIESFIVVAANGRSSKAFANTSSDHNAFYIFGKELRNDLIPFIERNFSTYAEPAEGEYDLTAARDHRAMAGLSMGGMQTINIGMCECLDIISYFGAFSACPTTNTAAVIATKLKEFPDYDIHYFYNLCGTEDGIAWASATGATKGLTDLTDKLTDGENYMWQQVPGGHDSVVWNLGFYNFAQMVFQE